MGRHKGSVKTGGRQKGSKNQITSSRDKKIEDFCETYSCDPIESLFSIASNINTPIDIRVSILKELAQYIYPKKRAIEVEATESQNPFIQIILPDNGTANS